MVSCRRGLHTLIRQEGVPTRETEGTILFNNNDNPKNFQWWLDPTPYDHEEFQSFLELRQDLGGGQVVVSRVYSNPVGEYAMGPYLDLFSVALHEIGHALAKVLLMKHGKGCQRRGPSGSHIPVRMQELSFPWRRIPMG